MSGHAMGALTVQVGAESFKLWLGMSVLADVQSEFPEAFDRLVAGSTEPPPLKMVHCLVAKSLERWHPVQAADRFFVDELLNASADLFQQLLNASAPKPAAQPGNRKARPTK